MKFSDTIEQFMFSSARYHISDRHGNTAALKIDYADNRYAIETLEGSIDASLRRELSAIARDLLKRKHGVNFANRVTPPRKAD